MKMNRIRWILSNVNVVNIALAAVLIVLGYNMLLPLLGKSAKLTLPAPKKQAAPPAAKADKPAESKSPSPSDFFLIAEQNVFHPERKIPVEKKEAQPLPKPDFVLYGTLMLDDLRVAYMEDKKAPQNAPTRGKKQISLRQGETLSGFVLKDIQADKVVMVRGDEKIDVHLDDPSKSKTRETEITATAQAAPPAPQHQTAPGLQRPSEPAAAKQPQPPAQVRTPAVRGAANMPAVGTAPPSSTNSGAEGFRNLFRRR